MLFRPFVNLCSTASVYSLVAARHTDSDSRRIFAMLWIFLFANANVNSSRVKGKTHTYHLRSSAPCSPNFPYCQMAHPSSRVLDVHDKTHKSRKNGGKKRTGSHSHERSLHHRRTIARLAENDLIHDSVLLEDGATGDAESVPSGRIVLDDGATARYTSRLHATVRGHRRRGWRERTIC